MKIIFLFIIIFTLKYHIVISFNEPPVIDISPLLNPTNYNITTITNIQQQIIQAGSEWGFFQIINHNINETLQNQLKNQLKAFFFSSKSLKYSVKRTEFNSRGYADDELTKQLKDDKELYDIGPNTELFTNLTTKGLYNQQLDGINYWPNEEKYIHLKGFRFILEEYYKEVLQLSRILMNIIIMKISMNCSKKKQLLIKKFFNENFIQHSSFLRLNFYPLNNIQHVSNHIISMDGSNSISNNNINNATLRYGVSRHTDAGALTILLQIDSISGLEVYTGTKEDINDGEWIPITPISGGLTINIGDMLQVWTNGILKAPEHRVQSSHKQIRFSVPFFYNPNYDTIIKPIICSKNKESLRKYEAIR